MKNNYKSRYWITKPPLYTFGHEQKRLESIYMYSYIQTDYERAKSVSESVYSYFFDVCSWLDDSPKSGTTLVILSASSKGAAKVRVNE